MSAPSTTSVHVPRVVPLTRSKSLRVRLRDPRVKGWLFLLPLLIMNSVVILIPSVSSVWYSFTDWTGLGAAHFVGVANYVELAANSEFKGALWHNVVWTIFFLVVPMALALFGAYALSRMKRFAVLFRTIYFVPYIVASVVNASIWRILLSPDLGIGKWLGINFFGDASWAFLAVMIVNTWAWWGFLLVVFLAAMQGVNPSLYEAAEIDGAGQSRQFFSITLPSIRPTLMFLGLMTIIWSFLTFDYVYILTQGGPAGSTELLSTLLYREAFANLRAGYASAIGVIMALISGVVVAVYLWVRRAKDWEM